MDKLVSPPARDNRNLLSRAVERAAMERWLEEGGDIYWRRGGRLALRVLREPPGGGTPGLMMLQLFADPHPIAVSDDERELVGLVPLHLAGEALDLLRMAETEAPPEPAPGEPRPAGPPAVELVRTGG